MAHFIDFMTYRWTGSCSLWNPAKDHLSLLGMGFISGPWHLCACHFPPRTLHSGADIRARKPHRQEFAWAQNLDDFQRIYSFWLPLDFWAAIQGKKRQFPLTLWRGKSRGKTFRGISWVLFYVLTQTSFLFAGRFGAELHFQRIWESRAPARPPTSGLVLQGSCTMDFINWLSFITLSIFFPKRWYSFHLP